MIIDNVEALKSWLAKLLEPICDADPSALANYVVALVKKDKPENELKALCADQLDVFLQKETTGFVDKLFECLTTKNYLGSPPAKETPKEEIKPTVAKSEPVEVEVLEEERDTRRRRSPLRNRSDFNESRGRDDRRRDERKRRDMDRHGKGTESHRERERHDRRRASPRGRSHSRSRSRSRSGSRGKSRDKEHSRGRDYRSKFEVERKDPDSYNSSGGPTNTQQQQQQHPPPLLPLPTPHPFSSSVPGPGGPASSVATPAHLPDSTTESWSSYYANHREGSKPFNKSTSLKQRCRDYDEKGFCVRGDLCPFDHGNDPLIVDDVTLPAMIPFPPPPIMPPARLPMPPMSEPPPSHRMPIPPHGQPPPPGIFPMTDNYDPEAYNPESPGLTAPGRTQYRQFIPRIQTQRSNLIGLTSGDGQGSRGIATANIVIQTEPSVASVPCTTSRYNAEQDARKRSLAPAEGAPPVKKPWMDKSNFNNQHKPIFPKKSHYVNTKLEVRKIPRELNNITKLNEHFSKFGTIVNIQVVFGGDPEAALIQYTANEEARRAISSIEAVLNNRFIRVYWHHEPNGGSQQQDLCQAQQGPAQSTPLGPSMGPQYGGQHKVIKQHNAAAYVLNKTVPKHRLTGPSSGPVAGSKADSPHPSTDPAAMVSTSAALQKGPYPSTGGKAGLGVGKALARSAKALEAQEVFKKKQEALKLQQDMRKKKQEMQEKRIECQKALISRLEKNRGMKPEERANIMKTLKELTDKISLLQTEMHPSLAAAAATTTTPPAPAAAAGQSHPANASAQPKTKTDAQKELLDAELDFHKKLSSGEDTTDLKRRLGQLQVEATWLGLIRPPAGRGKMPSTAAPGGAAGPPRGRGRGRGRGMRGRGGGNHMVVDHRPRALAILGLTQEEKEELMPHFVKFGEIEDLRDQDATSVVMTFRTRSEAENAANQGAKFNGRVLQISWYKPKTPSVSTEPEEEESKEEASTVEVGSYLPGEEEEEEEDDDEDDEYESRSWRR
ncbi:RNA-binding protein 27 [Aplochiton taeniatus]